MNIFSNLVNQDRSIFLNTVYYPLKASKDKILGIAFAALSCFALALLYIFYHHQNAKTRKVELLKNDPLTISPLRVLPIKEEHPKEILLIEPKMHVIPEQPKPVVEVEKKQISEVATPPILSTSTHSSVESVTEPYSIHQKSLPLQGKIKENIAALICQPKYDFALKGCLEVLNKSYQEIIEPVSIVDINSVAGCLMMKLAHIKRTIDERRVDVALLMLDELRANPLIKQYKEQASFSLYLSSLYVACLLQENKRDQAEQVVDYILLNSSQSESLDWFYIFKAEILRQQKDFITANNQFTSLSKENIYVQLIQASILLMNQQLPEAKSAFEKILEKSPHISYAHSRLGEILRRQGNLNTAIEEFKKALKFSPKDFYTLANYANALRQQGDLASAKKLWLEALQIEPDNFYALFLYAETLRQQGNLKEAKEQFEKISKMNHNAFYVFSLHGEILRREGELGKAKELFQEAIKREEKDCWTLFCHAETLRQNKDLAEAEAQFRRVVIQEPNHSEALTGLGFTLMSQNRFKEGTKILDPIFLVEDSPRTASIMMTSTVADSEKTTSTVTILKTAD